MTRIDKSCTNIAFYRLIKPWETRTNREAFFPDESKGSGNLVQVTDLFEHPTEEQKKIFPDKWIHELFTTRNFDKKYADYKYSLIRGGLTEDQATSLINFSFENAQRAQEWAVDNEKKGKISSIFMDFGLGFGVFRKLFLNGESNSFFTHIIDMVYGFCNGMRGFYQYHLYGRPDDEISMNIYQADVYGNKIAGFLGETTRFMETKINPFLFPLTGLLSHKYQDSILSSLILPNLLWWRARMPAHINQEFLTDLCRFIINKPLALIGRKKSIETLDSIKKRGNIEPEYVLRRHFENSGIKDKKKQTIRNLITESFKLVKNSFSKDLNKQKESSKKTGETIAPLLGIAGLVSFGIFKPIKLLIGTGNRVINFLSSLGGPSQQIIYLFKMVIPVFNDIKKLELDILKDENTNKTIIKEKRELLKKKRNLFYTGISCFTSNLINPFFKLINIENEFIKKLSGIVSELSDGLVAKFFSYRRHVLGLEFKVKNPEFFIPLVSHECSTRSSVTTLFGE